MNYVPWPEGDEPLSFGALTAPVLSAIRFAYRLERQHKDQDIPWTGPNIGEGSLVVSFPPDLCLTRKNLAYSLDDQGRCALEEIIGIAVQLGIEQGRRMEVTSSPSKMRELSIALALDTLKGISTHRKEAS